MRVATVKESKNHEYRVGLTPESVGELVRHGHEVLVERGAGSGIGVDDDGYRRAGAQISPDAAAVFAAADMIVKVKEPQADECAMLREGQILYTYLHLASDAEQTRALVASKAVCIAYETITDAQGGLPLLKPMSLIAGRLALQAGARMLEKSNGGRGILLGQVPGVLPAQVVIIGGGGVGFNAAIVAVGMGADVTVLDRRNETLERLNDYFGGRVKTRYSYVDTLAESVIGADLVIGAALVPGAVAPKLVTRAMVNQMKPGSVLVDVAIDQGGCFETSRPTTHAEPTYCINEVVHYCVTNMPGAVPRTSTYALNNATLSHALNIADHGWRAALKADPHLRNGLNVCAGEVTCAPVAEELGYRHVASETLLGI